MRALHVLAASCCVIASIVAVPVSASPMPVKAAVLRSQGTQLLGMTIWNDLNTGWSQFGETPVQIDYTSLAGYGWTLESIAATGADVLILSDPGYLNYWPSEIDAVRQYVQAGHGLIISYGKFRDYDRALAPLVGISESVHLGTGTSSFPIEISELVPGHALFDNVTMPYASGVRFVAHTSPLGPWPLDGGTIVANLFNGVGSPLPSIIVRDAGAYRGVYFSYYIEDKADGANLQDMQVFYNALLWTPEPSSLCILLSGAAMVLARRRTDGTRELEA